MTQSCARVCFFYDLFGGEVVWAELCVWCPKQVVSEHTCCPGWRVTLTQTLTLAGVLPGVVDPEWTQSEILSGKMLAYFNKGRDEQLLMALPRVRSKTYALPDGPAKHQSEPEL